MEEIKYVETMWQVQCGADECGGHVGEYETRAAADAEAKGHNDDGHAANVREVTYRHHVQNGSVGPFRLVSSPINADR
jgi:hypothetical protein